MSFTFQQQIPFQSQNGFSNADMGVEQLCLGSLREESPMATLKKRGENWYARVQWRAIDHRMKEKQIPLRTTSKVEAHQRYLRLIG